MRTPTNIEKRLAKLEAALIKPSPYLHMNRDEMITRLKSFMQVHDPEHPLCPDCPECLNTDKLVKCQRLHQLLQKDGRTEAIEQR